MNRPTLINKFIKERNFASYLELGVYDKTTFNTINCENKKCVDFQHPADYQMSTDDFFVINKNKYDIIFIDANHTESYLSRDIKNSLKILNPNGVIVLHDVNPPDEFSQIDSNNLYQTAWKAFVKFRFSTEFLTYSYSSDCGLGVIDTSKKTDIKKQFKLHNIQYADLDKNRNSLLGVIY
jgi:hypothetical protein